MPRLLEVERTLYLCFYILALNLGLKDFYQASLFRFFNTGEERTEHLYREHQIIAKKSAGTKGRTNKSANSADNGPAIASNNITKTIDNKKNAKETSEANKTNQEETSTQKVVCTDKVIERGPRPIPFINESVQNIDDLEDNLEDAEVGFDADSDQELDDGKFKYRLDMTGKGGR